MYKKIKRDDTVKVICGKDIGKSGNVLQINRNKGRVLVEGINFVKKTMRKSKENQNGSIRDIEAFINISNVMLICPKCKKGTRVGFKIGEQDQKKSRICKKCNSDID